MKPDDEFFIMTADGKYMSASVQSIYRQRAVYGINVRYKPLLCSLRYATDCQMFVVDA